MIAALLNYALCSLRIFRIMCLWSGKVENQSTLLYGLV